MTRKQWAPGNWQVVDAKHGRYIENEHGHTIALVYHLDSWGRTDANARVLAASKNLHDACEHALEHVTDALLYPDDDELVVALRAALAKARGDD